MYDVCKETGKKLIELPLGWNLIWHQFIDDEHLDSDWYGGLIAEIQYEDLSAKIYAIGDVRVEYKDDSGNVIEVSDKNNEGLLFDELGDVLKNDKELREAANEGNLTYWNNNWFEFYFFDRHSGEGIEMPFDSLLDDSSVDEAIESVIVAIKEYIAKR